MGKLRIVLNLIVCVAFFYATPAFCNAPSVADSVRVDSTKMNNRFSVRVENSPHVIFDMALVRRKAWTKLYSIPNHPNLDASLTAADREEILAQVNKRKKELDKDTLLTSDMMYIWQPYFSALHHEDPHYRVGMIMFIDEEPYNGKIKKFYKESKTLPFTHVCINDTIVVDKSLDPRFERGDMITHINKVPMAEYLKYGGYQQRYSNPFPLVMHYYYSFADKFKVDLIRSNREMVVEIEGSPTTPTLHKLVNKEDYNVQLFRDAKSGYISIQEFYYDNSRLINKVTSAIEHFKKEGCTNVILDLRKNPGGSGDRFDELLSIFIDKPTIPYLKGQKLKVSKYTINDYDFITEDMLGSVIDIPDKYLIKEIELIPKMYIEGMKYYVLISKDTGSTASSFVNIMQYNGAAELVGEPLLHNALKYGEVIQGVQIRPSLLTEGAISTTQIDEHTKAVDGVVMPDIHIPYVAKDYLTGEDAMFEKLLEYISSTNAKEVSALTN